MAERLVFDLLAIDHASQGFVAAGRTAQVASDKVDGLKKRLDEIGARSVKAQVGLKGNKEALAQLDRLQVKLLALGEHKVHSDISLEGFARASTEITALDLELDRLNRKMRGPGGISGAAYAAVNALGGLAGVGTTLINPITIAAAALAAIMAGPLLAALLPITAGFALFAAVAIPEISKVWKAVDQGPKALAKLPPAERAIVADVRGMKTQFGQLAKAVQPEVLTAFGVAIRIIRQLMPALKPLLIAAGQAADQFLKNLSAWLASPSGKKFLNWLETEGPKDIAKFGRVLWDFAKITGQVFTFLRNAGNTWWRNVTHVISDVDRLVTVVAPAAFDIFKESVRIAWDQIKIAFLQGELSITTTMGHLPGPLGAPFRQASKDIRASLAGIQADVRDAANSIQADWDRLHGKTVTLSFNINPGPGGSNSPNPATRRFASGTAGAPPGWAWVGERGPELAYFRGGETVIPSHVARGFAGGTGFSFRDQFRPPVSKFAGQLQAAFDSAESKVIAANRAAALSRLIGGLTPPGPAGGAPAALEAFAASLFRGFGWGPDQLPPLVALWNRESGWNRFARNPSSGAYGIPQALPPTKLPFAGQAAGGSSAAAQIGWGESYIKGRYGSPFAAWVHETMFNWYDHGGWLPPGVSVAVNRTGRRERVVGPDQPVQVLIQVTGSAPRNEADAFLVSWLKRLIASGHLNVQIAP